VNVGRIREKNRILRFLEREPFLHIYETGDLDDFSWSHTEWFAIQESDAELTALALLYSGTDPPTLLALADQGREALSLLVEALVPELPPRVYAHLSPGLVRVLERRYASQAHGTHVKLALVDASRVAAIDTAGVLRLGREDAAEVAALYRRSYPGHWFDPRMLDTGQYFGARDEGSLVAVGGVHVYSRAYRVAAIGNVTTSPEHRGKGLATRVSARLCSSLLGDVDRIGLNVRADNQAAIACYERVGFARISWYEECLLAESDG
jgi:predicted GNAT family acetyltransferase